MIKTKKWKDAEAESSVTMCTEDWMADEIDGLREELHNAYKQSAELMDALKFAHRHMNGGRDMLKPMEFHEWFRKISAIIKKAEEAND